MTSPAYMTVVFEFKNEDDRLEKTLELAPYFLSDDDSLPMRVITISGKDEATKLELVEKKLTIAHELSTGALLVEAANEIKKLREKITSLRDQLRYKPGTELTYLILAGRINGFRVIFNRNPIEKEDAARELLNSLRESTGLDYGDDLYDSLIKLVKNINTVETIS